MSSCTLQATRTFPVRGNSYSACTCGSDYPPRTKEYPGVLKIRFP
jgi:hypothetical protein